jgi:tol-pal system protein YbgF
MGVLDNSILRAPMIRFAVRILVAVLGCALLAASGPAAAQSSSDVTIRLDQLENQVRQLTGTIEELQYRNQQLEQSLRRMQDDYESRFQQLSKAGPARPSAVPVPASASGPSPSGPASPSTAMPSAVPGRRSDAFDPSQNPNAPGVPRTLGSMAPASESGAAGSPPAARPTGAPLDLSTMEASGQAPPSSSMGPPSSMARADLPPPSGTPLPPPGRGPQVSAVSPPSQSPRDEYDLAYGYLLRKDYDLAAQEFQTFLRSYPNDAKAGEAQFWLGESLFQRQNYHDAADAFLGVTRNYENSIKAPDALLRLGQSLAALGQKELACSTLGEVAAKYPRASLNVKQGVDREQKRVHC